MIRRREQTSRVILSASARSLANGLVESKDPCNLSVRRAAPGVDP